ncbi:MAG: DUF6531 domain-containing protein, partial [Carboxydocellales bacterium]
SKPFDPQNPGGWSEKNTSLQDGGRNLVESLIPKPSQLDAKGLNEIFDFEDHVDVTTGTVKLESTDLFIPSPYIPLMVKRVYTGPQEEHGPLGYSWVFNYHQYLQMYEEFKIVEYRGDGNHQLYNYTENDPDAMVPSYDGDPIIYYNLDDGYYTSASQFNNSILTRHSMILYTVSAENGTVYNYFGYKAPWRKALIPNPGKLTSVKDPNGNKISLNYSKNGNLSKVGDSFGKKLTFEFTGELLTRVTDPLGRAIKYEYDGNKNLIKVTDFNGSEETYTYDSSHQLTSWKNTLGRTTTYVYDSEGRVIESSQSDDTVKRSYQYYPDQQKTVVNDTNGTMVYEYDEYNNIIRVVNTLNNTTSYSWDKAGNLTNVTELDGAKTVYRYDNGIVTKIIQSDGSTITGSYEFINKLVFLTVEQNGVKQIYRYDSKGNLLSFTNGNKKTTFFAYDPNDKLTAVTEPSGKRISLDYDRNGYLKEIRRYKGPKISYSFDVVGRLLSYTDPGNKKTVYEYQGDRLVKETHPNGVITRYEYNKTNQLAKIMDSLNGTTVLKYNLKGQLISVLDSKGREYTYSYDNYGRLVIQSLPS